jgi:hypothetical protein
VGVRGETTARTWIARRLRRWINDHAEVLAILRRLADTPSPPVAVVPAEFTAHLASREAGRVIYEPSVNLFAPTPAENTYVQARIYTKDLDWVPLVTDRLIAEQWCFPTSSATRVLEMQGYSRSLGLLAETIMVSVFVFGILTVVFIFVDVTYRQRGAIGIMRIMGMPPGGIFCIVFTRALVIGALGGLISVAIGLIVAAIINSFRAGACVLELEDALKVFGAALTCCVIGVFWPAWKAKTLDPVDAILSSKSH